MMIKFGLHLLGFLLLNSSCTGNNQGEGDTSYSIKIRNIDIVENIKNSNEKEHFLLSEIADNFDIVQLEFTEKSMISSIEDVQISDEYIFIRDSKSDVVLKFSKSGSFINLIGKIGQGPGEYKYLHYMALMPDKKEVYLYTNRGMKIYDFDGRFIKNINNTIPNDIFNTVEPRFYVFNNNLFLNDKLPVLTKSDLWSLALVDSSFNISRKFYTPSFLGREKEIISHGTKYDKHENYWTDNFPSIDLCMNNFMISYYGVDTIYQFVDSCTIFTPQYSINMGKKPSFKTSHEWIKSNDFFSSFWLYDFCNTKDFIFLSICKNGSKYIVKYNKNTEDILYAKKNVEFIEANFLGFLYKRVKDPQIEFINDFCSNTNFIVNYKSKGYYIDIVSPEYIKNEYSKFNINIEEYANPVLLIAKLIK